MKSKNNRLMPKTMRIRRYTFLRYMTSLVFFLNLYRIIVGFLNKAYIKSLPPLVICLGMILVSLDIMGAVEKRRDEKIGSSEKIIDISIGILLPIFFICTFSYKSIFPFLLSKSPALMFLGINIIILSFCLRNIKKIKTNKDKTYLIYNQYNKQKNDERIKYV